MKTEAVGQNFLETSLIESQTKAWRPRDETAERIRPGHTEKDAKEIFKLTQKKWAEDGLSGRALYDYAKQLAEARGWVLGFGGASGHRIADFPHAVHDRGHLRTQDYQPSANRWILEIHLHDPQERFGAFYADLL